MNNVRTVYSSVAQLLEDRVHRSPDATAFAAPGRVTLTYGRLHTHVFDTVRTLNRFGIGRGDRVAIVLPNGPEMAAAFLGVAAGATSAPLNPAYRSNDFEFYLSDLGAKALIISSDLDSPARSVAASLGIPVIESSTPGEAGAGIFALEGEPVSDPVPAALAGPDDVALVLHTSGTTSRPKQVPLTQKNLCTSACNIRSTLALTDSDRCLNVMPLFHIHGLVGAILSSLSSGASVVCSPGFDASQFFVWLTEEDPTWYTAVPTMHQAVVSAAGDHSEIVRRCRLRLIRSSSSSLPPSLMSDLERLFDAPVIESYGMTEASHQMTSNLLPPGIRKPGSVGVPAGPEVAVMGEADKLLGRKEEGEIVIRGPNVTAGYAGNGEANAQSFSAGWFRTGDRGRMDGDGYLFITGRLKEMINRGGENIAPREVDEVLLEHPAVAQATAFAVPHPTLGEDLAAAVVVNADSDITEQALRDYGFERLADFKVPSRVIFVDQIPKGPTGKLQRIGLADKLAEQLKSEFVAPRNELEQQLSEIWAEALSVERVGIRGNFFMLGGDSLLAARLFTKIDRLTNAKLPLSTLFRAPTVEQFAAMILDDRREDEPSTIPPSAEDCLVEVGRWGSIKNRILQLIALYIPGIKTTRGWLHRMRGVQVGNDVSIGAGVIIETQYPQLVSIGNNASIGIRSVIIAHYRGSTRSLMGDHERTVQIEDDAYIGPGVIVLPNVTIGHGAVVAAGSVVTKSVPPQTMVRGNPAEPVAHCDVPFTDSYEEFARNLKPLGN